MRHMNVTFYGVNYVSYGLERTGYRPRESGQHRRQSSLQEAALEPAVLPEPRADWAQVTTVSFLPFLN